MMVRAQPTALLTAREEIQQTREQVEEYFSSAKSRILYGVDATYLDQIERESIEVPFGLLKEFSRYYSKPVAYFFAKRPKRIELVSPADDKRTYTSVENRKGLLDRETLLEVKHAKGVRSITAEYAPEFFADKRIERITLDANIAEVAARYRQLFLRENYAPANCKRYFEHLRSCIEDLGVLVIQSSLSKQDDIRGLTFTTEKPYLVIVNKNDGYDVSYAPRVFTIMHEFAHVLLRDDSLCDDDLKSKNNVEVFCNKFASNFLLPSAQVTQEYEQLAQSSNTSILEKIQILRDKFCVSFHAVTWKLKELHFMDQDEALALINRWEVSQRENFVMPHYNPPKPATSVKTAFGDKLPAQLVRNDRMSPVEVSAILNVRLDHFGDIKRAFG